MAIYTLQSGTNADLMANVEQLYFKPGMKIADVTWGKGVFWKNIDTSKYRLAGSDLIPRANTPIQTPINFRNLPYPNDSMDVLVLDPPYMHNPGKPIVDANYQNKATSATLYHADITDLFYRMGMAEGHRVLKPGGLMLVKCGDELEAEQQMRGHIEVWEIATRELRMQDKDMFILNNGTPHVQKLPQKHARKNATFLWVFIKQSIQEAITDDDKRKRRTVGRKGVAATGQRAAANPPGK